MTQTPALPKKIQKKKKGLTGEFIHSCIYIHSIHASIPGCACLFPRSSTSLPSPDTVCKMQNKTRISIIQHRIDSSGTDC